MRVHIEKEGNEHCCHDQRALPLLSVILVQTIRTNLSQKCCFHALVEQRAGCQHSCFLLYFPGLIVAVCLCENCTFRGRFGKGKALGVVADLKTTSTVVKMLAWALQEALGSPQDPGHKRLPTKTRHLQARPPRQSASCLQGLLLFKRQLALGHGFLRVLFQRTEHSQHL